jgi:alpha-L-rhamnosidase
MGLFDQALVPAMVRNLAATVTRENNDDGGVLRPKHSLMTGFIGTAWISQALSDAGRSDLAYTLLLNNQYPSWLYAIDQGATTIWERLNGYTVENGFGGNNSMNSFNHYSFGAVGQWMMAYSLGIQRDEPGFRKFILQPEPDPTGTLTFAQGHYDSPYGRIESAWKLAPGQFTYTATVPPNTTATLYLPAKDAISAQGLKPERQANGKAVYTLTSGTYTFTAAR